MHTKILDPKLLYITADVVAKREVKITMLVQTYLVEEYLEIFRTNIPRPNLSS